MKSKGKKDVLLGQATPPHHTHALVGSPPYSSSLSLASKVNPPPPVRVRSARTIFKISYSI